MACFRNAVLICIALTLCLFSTACNDAPTDVDGALIPGTDTLYSMSSDTVQLIASTTTVTTQKPLLNGAYVLIGNTTDSRGVVFVQISSYPAFPAPNDYTIVSADLEMIPSPYLFGDTTDKTLSISGYELKKRFPLDVTWDSVYRQDGSTDYYGASDPKLLTYDRVITDPADTLVYVPVDKATMKRWVDTFTDTTARRDLFGIAIVPENMRAVRQFKNLNGATQLMRYRVITKHKDSADNDTTYLSNVFANIVNTPVANGELVTQGARIHTLQTVIDLTKIPANALIISAKLRFALDQTKSQGGNNGLDEVLALYYTLANGTESYYATYKSDNEYIYDNVGYSLQQAIKSGKESITLTLKPTGVTELWQMNREVFTGAPKLSIVYTIPSVIQ